MSLELLLLLPVILLCHHRIVRSIARAANSHSFHQFHNKGPRGKICHIYLTEGKNAFTLSSGTTKLKNNPRAMKIRTRQARGICAPEILMETRLEIFLLGVAAGPRGPRAHCPLFSTPLVSWAGFSGVRTGVTPSRPRCGSSLRVGLPGSASL